MFKVELMAMGKVMAIGKNEAKVGVTKVWESPWPGGVHKAKFGQ